MSSTKVGRLNPHPFSFLGKVDHIFCGVHSDIFINQPNHRVAVHPCLVCVFVNAMHMWPMTCLHRWVSASAVSQLWRRLDVCLHSGTYCGGKMPDVVWMFGCRLWHEAVPPEKWMPFLKFRFEPKCWLQLCGFIMYNVKNTCVYPYWQSPLLQQYTVLCLEGLDLLWAKRSWAPHAS